MSNPFAVMFRGLQESPVGQFVGNLMRDEAQATAEAAVHQVTLTFLKVLDLPYYKGYLRTCSMKMLWLFLSIAGEMPVL